MDELGDRRGLEQRFLDELLPAEMDWEDVVRTYPLTSVTLAAVAGFLVGSRRGRAIVGAVAETVVDRVTGTVHDLVDREPT